VKYSGLTTEFELLGYWEFEKKTSCSHMYEE